MQQSPAHQFPVQQSQYGYNLGAPQVTVPGYAFGAPQVSGPPPGRGSSPHRTDHATGQVAAGALLPNLPDPSSEKEMKRRKQQEMQRALQAQMEENAQRKRERERMEKEREEKEEEPIRRDNGRQALPDEQVKQAAPGQRQVVHVDNSSDAQQSRPPRPPPYPTAATPADAGNLNHAAEEEDPKAAERRRKQEQAEAMQRDLQQQIQEKKAQKEREQRLLREEEERQEERIRRDMEIQAQREAAEKREKQQREMEVYQTQQAQQTPAMGKTRERLRDPEMGKTRDRLRERDPEMGKTRDKLRQTGMGKTHDRLRESDMGRSRKGRRPRTRGCEAAFSEPPARRTSQGGDPTSPKKRPPSMESPARRTSQGDTFRGSAFVQDGNDLSLGMRAFNERQQAFVQEMHQQVEGLRRQRDEVAQQAMRHREHELDRRVHELDQLQQQLVQQLQGRGSSNSSRNNSKSELGVEHHGASRRWGSQPPPRLPDQTFDDTSAWEKSLACDTRFVPANEPPTWLDAQGTHSGRTVGSHFPGMEALHLNPGMQGATAYDFSISRGPPLLLLGSSRLVPSDDLHQDGARVGGPLAHAGSFDFGDEVHQEGACVGVPSAHAGSFQFGGSASSGVGARPSEHAEQSDSWNSIQHAVRDMRPTVGAEQSGDDSWRLLDEPLRKREEVENDVDLQAKEVPKEAAKEMLEVVEGTSAESHAHGMPSSSSRADINVGGGPSGEEQSCRPDSSADQRARATDSGDKGLVLPEQQVETFKSALQQADGLPLELRDDLCKLLEEMPLGTASGSAWKSSASELPSLPVSKNSSARSQETMKQGKESAKRYDSANEPFPPPAPRPLRSGGSCKNSPRNRITSGDGADLAESCGLGRRRSRSNSLMRCEAARLQDESRSPAERGPGTAPARRRRISEERRAQSATAAQIRRAEDEIIDSMKCIPSPRSRMKPEDDALSQLLSSHSRPFSAPEY